MQTTNVQSPNKQILLRKKKLNKKCNNIHGATKQHSKNKTASMAYRFG